MRYMHRTIPIVCFVFLILLAGCNGVFNSNPHTDGTTSPLTPAPVPTDNPLNDLPDGLAKNGITDSFALANDHENSLININYTVRTKYTVTVSNGSRLVDTTSVQKVSANHDRWTKNKTLNGTYTNYRSANIRKQKVWYNGSFLFQKTQKATQTTYNHYRPSNYAYLDPTDKQHLLSYYLSANRTKVTIKDGLIEVRGALPPETSNSVVEPAINMTKRTITVKLTKSGRVEQYRVRYVGRLVNDPSTTINGIRVVRFSAHNKTTLERPDWVATTRNANSTTGV